MVGGTKNFIRAWLLLSAVVNAGCACGPGGLETNNSTGSSSASSSSSSSSGTGGSDLGPCGEDCTKIQTPECTVAVCNLGQALGPLNTCVVVPAPKGAACDDGKFCTTNDVCDNGVCAGGTPNRCGLALDPCLDVLCYEDSKSCDTTPVNEGGACAPADKCQINGTCHVGDCLGVPKDCTFSPLNECNKVACEPATGMCVGTADPDKEDAPCLLTGDVCTSKKTCKAGQCGGGVPKDCTAFNIGCEVGVCDALTGICGPSAAPVGTTCSDGIAECDVGACDAKGKCLASPGPNGVACNDHNACTKSDTCSSGICGGATVVGCQLYLQEGFESCANGWTFGGDWQCGAPINVGPPAAHTGTGVIATQIAGLYSVNQSYSTAVADSPPVDLTMATSPVLSFWAWDHTEGGTFDGWNLKASIDGGASFTDVTTVSPAYPLTIAGQLAWGGDHSTQGWQNYGADLKAYAGHSVILRFAFRSDGATVFPGVYIDDVVVSEPLESPLFITTPSPLPDVYAKMVYSAKIDKTGGSSGSLWSKVGGVNANWLTIDQVKGVLTGTPLDANVGPVSVTVQVQEPALPSNFAQKTFTFNVNKAAYYTSFETCPDGWTLAGDWQCGIPTNVGPATAFVGTQCLGTQLAGFYSNLDTWATTTATSPDIDLTTVANAKLKFRMWVNTEGATYDGANLLISTDGGATYSLMSSVTPAYNVMITDAMANTQPAWGSNQTALGWQAAQADLTNYAGQIIRLRFAFQSDSSGIFPGVYIDDILVN